MANYLNTLNTPQKDAVIHLEGPMMVIAGAGSGKTRVLTLRIAHLLEHGVDPFSILALTFTNKAAREMKERIEKVVGAEAKNLWMGTFHSVFAKMLRQEAHRLGYSYNFTIYDSQDSKSLLKSILDEMQLDEKIYKPQTVLARISDAKNNLLNAHAYSQDNQLLSQDAASSKPRLWEIYKQYETRCFRSGAMDFDDLLFQTHILFKKFPEVLRSYQERFRFVLVDEYQDTNYSQYVLIKQLSALHQNLCVVGDDAQSIYGFRGADIENILNFKNDYPNYKIYKLEQNYRSTQNIVEAANGVIAKNENQIPKKVWTSNPQGDKIDVVQAYTDNDEGRVVAESIFETKMNKQLRHDQFAILYRTNAQSRSLEESLRKINIPYKIYGGLSFYQRKEIKDLLAYFRLSNNVNDEESFKRIVNYPMRGIGDTTLEKLVQAANAHAVSLWEVAENPQLYPIKLVSSTVHKLQEFTKMIQAFSLQMQELDAYEMATQIAQHSGMLRELFQDKSPEGVSRYENLQELLNGIKEFVAATPPNEKRFLADFLIDVALLTDADKETEEDKDKVSLMTIHNAKGLEFDYVYIVGLEENLFPSQLSMNSRADLEEERRLFYVALTRAKQKAHLSFALQRYKWGQVVQCQPSRFLKEIDPVYLNHAQKTAKQEHTGLTKTQVHGKFLRLQTAGTKPAVVAEVGDFETDSNAFQVGMQVEHSRFGKGKILQIEQDKAMIFFPAVGNKQLLLKFAKLKIIG